MAWDSPRNENDRDTKILEMVADRCASALVTQNISERDQADEEVGRSLSEIKNTLSSALKFGDPNNR